METVTDFILGGSKITGDGDCSHEIKRRLLLGRKAKTKLVSSAQSLSHVQLFETPWTAACQVSLSISNFQSLLKLMSIESVTICSDFGAPQNKVSHCFHCFSIYLHEVMGPDAMIFIF